MTQLGTMAAVLLYFRHDLWRIGRAWLDSVPNPELRGGQDAKIGWFIVIGTIPISVFGLLFRNQIEDGARDLYLIGSALIVLGLVLLVAERVSDHERSMEQLTWRDGITIGFAQAAALVPGVSRSGATLTAGLFLGLKREAAARFSFLLSVPAVVLSGLFQVPDVFSGGGAAVVPTIIATVFAFVIGYASIAFLLSFLQNHSTYVFVGYRVVLGAVVIALVAANVIA